MQNNLWMHGSPMAPHRRSEGALRSLSRAQEDSLIEYLTRHPTAQQKETLWLFWEEWAVIVSQATVSRTVKRSGWSKRLAQRIATRRNEELRTQWQADLPGLTAEQLVFVDSLCLMKLQAGVITSGLQLERTLATEAIEPKESPGVFFRPI